MPGVRLEYEIRLELVIWNLTIVDLGEHSKVVAGSMATRLTGSTTPRVAGGGSWMSVPHCGGWDEGHPKATSNNKAIHTDRR